MHPVVATWCDIKFASSFVTGKEKKVTCRVITATPSTNDFFMVHEGSSTVVSTFERCAHNLTRTTKIPRAHTFVQLAILRSHSSLVVANGVQFFAVSSQKSANCTPGSKFLELQYTSQVSSCTARSMWQTRKCGQQSAFCKQVCTFTIGDD